MKMAIGLVLAAAIGAACRFFDLPVPAPPKLLGALLVASMTMGYMSADKFLTTRANKAEPPEIEQKASR